MWEEIYRGFRLEFADLTDVVQTTRLIFRSLLAAILGGAVGWQRERSGKDAGVRTHMLVCIGTAFFVAIPQLAGFDNASISRIIQGITAGIGFLGAGAILKHESLGKIEGLTTAATVWFAAAIGIAVGIGREASAIIGAILVLVVLALVPKSERND